MEFFKGDTNTSREDLFFKRNTHSKIPTNIPEFKGVKLDYRIK